MGHCGGAGPVHSVGSNADLLYVGHDSTILYGVKLVFNLNLHGIISGLVIVYETAAVVMLYIVLTLDWNKISEGIIRESKKAAQKW